PPVDAAPVDLLSFGLPAYGLPTLRVNLPQSGSEPLHVSNPAIEPSGRPAAYAAAAPPASTAVASPAPEAFEDRWSVAGGASGVPEWFAQQKTAAATASADTPSVIYADTAGP